jgi:hypothetical protein
VIDLCLFTHKVTYLSKYAAELALRQQPDRPGMRAYLCQEYSHWHVGHPFRSLREKVNGVALYQRGFQ